MSGNMLTRTTVALIALLLICAAPARAQQPGASDIDAVKQMKKLL
ncbi:MAG TPA: hypothetical protein VE775_10050 [Pyrinomonadaceae bacterium]|nr:hypothetical protein [Pyrinomonadaceae bacterium]